VVLGIDELLTKLTQTAEAAVNKRSQQEQAAGQAPQSDADSARRLKVGLTGYPNVGKSSTINALFGSKKTAVAPTPGKTKHFQTLNVTEQLMLCDCPGLVLPRYAASKAEMVAAGVIPIDRLTDMRAPVEVVAQRVSRAQLEQVYGLRLPAVGQHEDPNRLPTAAELLRAHALSRGWVVGSGLPDETRSGRQILKDFVSGKLLHCMLPPNCTATLAQLGLTGQPGVHQPSAAEVGGPATPDAVAASQAAGAPHPSAAPQGAAQLATGSQQTGTTSGLMPDDSSNAAPAADEGNSDVSSNASSTHADRGFDALHAGRHANAEAVQTLGAEQQSHIVERAGASVGVGAADRSHALPETDSMDASSANMAVVDAMDEADLELLESIRSADKPAKSKRPEYKFNKKPARTKGNRGKADDGGDAYDGSAFTTGKRGGLVRVPAAQ
jgi:large subunit GTPase 1